MNTRVKIEFADGSKGRYAFVTNEHSACSYGQPVAVMSAIAYGAGDFALIGATIVTADRGLAAQLGGIGFAVRVSDPQAAWQKENMRVISTKLTNDKYNRLKLYCQREGISISAALNAAVERMIIQ